MGVKINGGGGVGDTRGMGGGVGVRINGGVGISKNPLISVITEKRDINV